MARRGSKLRRTWPQRFLLGLDALLVVACLAAAASLTLFKDKLSNVSTVVIDSAKAAPVEASEARNILIIGTDSAGNLAADDPVLAGREPDERLADVIMVLRIDPEAGTARLLSFPRDSRVAVAPGGGHDRINGAISGPDGPRNLIDTIRRNFGIAIDNYIEVDFGSFRDLVSTLDGVPVYFAAPVRDKNTGLLIEEPGCVNLDPVQALAYARSRHFQYKGLDGRWHDDESGDLGRITRQQDFIKRALRRASDKGLRNPGTAIGLVDAASKSVVMDNTLNSGTILQLVDLFRDFNPDELKTNQIVTYSDPIDGIAYQSIDMDASIPLMLPFWGYNAGKPLPPRNIVVDVVGNRSQSAALTTIAGGLAERGFSTGTMETRRSAGHTTITYGPAGFDAALTLATWMNDTPELEFDSEIVGPRLEVSVGSEFGGLRDKPIAVDDLPAPMRVRPSDVLPAPAGGEATTTSTVVPTSDSAAAPSTTPDGAAPDASTSSTLPGTSGAEDPTSPGVVPTDPAKAAACR